MPINRLIPWIAALFLPITGGAHAETAPFAGSPPTARPALLQKFESEHAR